MVRTKLEELRKEILNYIGIPYHTNIPKVLSKDNVVVGKGNAKEIALKTIEIANNSNIKLINLSAQEIYNLQKKNKIGIDCSGLACHLLNFFFNQKIDVRRTSANMLTSPPLSRRIDVHDIQTADIIRQKNGHHVLFVIEKINNTVIYVDSSRLGRGVRYGEFEIDDQNFKHEGAFRLTTS